MYYYALLYEWVRHVVWVKSAKGHYGFIVHSPPVENTDGKEMSSTMATSILEEEEGVLKIGYLTGRDYFVDD